MANPPPPYDNITGISRAVMKDNAQETLANYDGNARPGELVVNLVVDPPTLWIGNNSGQLTQISSGSGGNTGDWVFSAGNATTSTDVEIFVTGYPGRGASVNSDEYAQLYWSANVLGNVDVFDPDNGGNLFTWAYVDSTGFYVQFKDDANNLDYEWQFRNDGNLTYPDGTVNTGGAVYAATNASVQMISNNTYNQVRVDDANVEIYTSPNGATQYQWTFDNTGNLTAPGDISATGNISAGNIGVSERITCRTVVTDPAPLSNLTAVPGARGFINDGNLAAAGNFGAQVSGNGGNSVPVWSDGVNWYIG